MLEAGTHRRNAHLILHLGFWIMPDAGTHPAERLGRIWIRWAFPGDSLLLGDGEPGGEPNDRGDTATQVELSWNSIGA